ncbi:dihydroxyacetone kinase subunit DhaL [Mycobacterium sp. 21AC1]|uniref:dihydroxyacetone kinase subunit DhaL n=1 Tax=[Mycobacterium] appelbergii TaxID=2939269 RepID=UPI0029392366|nr:dihydroxyacetone kinase subunit DhaL [Mycobacterium sp. 21AC1]MDV3129521.1 dihydroxyacetone kinase subunit DhaL [Mycobacterium sp. 21AC1]
MSATTLPADLMAIWMSATADLLAEACPRLTELDAAVGDADHGVNMESGFRAIAKELAAQKCSSPSQTLLTAASVLRKTTGGTSGALWAGALRRAGKALEGADVFDQWALLHALEEAWSAIGELGGASEGDNTLLDAVLPATRSLRSQLEAGAPLPDAIREAHRAAEEGAAATADRIAVRGRAAYLGERAIGTPDPGAVSAAVVFQGLVTAAAN